MTHDEILQAVRAALQPAEESGGPEGGSYIALMNAVKAEAQSRIDAYRAQRGLMVETARVVERRDRFAYCILSGPHRGVEFYASDEPSEDDLDEEVEVIFHPDAQHACQLSSTEGM